MLCGFEQQTKQQLPVAHAQAAQLLGQRKHQMEIGRGQEFSHSVFHPLATLHTSTTRAVPVATAMELIMQMGATFIAAPVMMHSYGRCMATAQTA